MMPEYIIQYSHDQERWFGIGADAVKPPMVFGTLHAAMERLEYLQKHYQYLMRYARVVDYDNGVIIQQIEMFGIPIRDIERIRTVDTSGWRHCDGE